MLERLRQKYEDLCLLSDFPLLQRFYKEIHGLAFRAYPFTINFKSQLLLQNNTLLSICTFPSQQVHLPGFGA